MGIRDRLTKMFGSAIPPQMQAGEAASQMTPASPFSPGTPIAPYDGYSRTPRSQDYVTGYNISSRPRTHERMSFDALRALIEAYDVAQMCIWHRIDSIRALDWSLVPARGFAGDADAAIAEGMAVLEKPDRQTPFANWLATWLYDVLAYDAGTLYRLRNRGGRAIGLRVVDGTSIAPLLDYWGNSPEVPAEAYVQYAQGLPWNWLTRDDLIYQPFRPRTNSPYGTAPLETVLLNANTDLRFQAYFLQRFTEGNVPEAFASSPESWSPDQIEQFQAYWDAAMLGDQAAKHQIKWMPGGSSIAWSNEKDFSDTFSLHLMRKTCAAFHIVPTDLGFTQTANRSSGETQADVQHRVGDLPLIAYIQGVLTHFLRDDLGLQLEFAFDTGQEKEDRLALAQAWQIYVASGIASPDEAREKLLGLPSDPERPTPRFFSTTTLGPVPLLSILGMSGKVDPETFGPAEDQPLAPFVPPPAVVPNTGTPSRGALNVTEDAYRTQIAGQLQADNGGAPTAAVAPPAPPADSAPPVTKEAAAAPAAASASAATPAAATAGITSETGITGYDLIGRQDDEEEQEQLVKRELTAFRRFRQARRRAGTWRDFTFQHVDPAQARSLNQAARFTVRKDAGIVACAGLAVQAQDTGRILMIQRALDPTDPASGCWEFPGGHLEGAETPLTGAWRKWAEETGLIPPPGVQTGTWISPDGIYQGIVWTVPSEDAVPIAGDREITNPDDPDGDQDAIAWWNPAQLPGNPALRPELLACLPDVLAALGLPADGSPPVYEPVTEPGPDEPLPTLAKTAGDSNPKGQGGDWPGWQYDQRTADYWAPLIAAALAAALTANQATRLARDFAAAQAATTSGDVDENTLTTAALTRLTSQINQPSARLTDTLTGLYTDAYLIGTTSAQAVTGGGQPALGTWRPGDTTTARTTIEQVGTGTGLTVLLAGVANTAASLTGSRVKDAAKALARGTLAGDPPKTVGAAIQDALTDPDRAAASAITEVTRGSGSGAAASYQQQGVTLGQWVVDPGSHVCAVCDANAAAGPMPLGAPYPSGDAYPPAHPNCRCAVVSA